MTTETHGVKSVLKAVIASGVALSGELDLNGFRHISIQMPSAWTTANLTFQVAEKKGGIYQDVYDSSGNEFVVTAAVSRAISDITELAPFRFIKIRSGTTGTPVNQAAKRTLQLILKG